MLIYTAQNLSRKALLSLMLRRDKPLLAMSIFFFLFKLFLISVILFHFILIQNLKVRISSPWYKSALFVVVDPVQCTNVVA